MLKNICKIVVDTGAVINEMRGRVKGKEADSIADKMLTEYLNKLTPEIRVISEEGWQPKRRPKTYWLIDPIDGTASFDSGYNGFVTQVALMVEGQPVMAAIYAPATDELFYSQKGCGAYKGDTVLQVNTGDPVTLIDNYPVPVGAAEELYLKLGLTNYIESGSIALKMCRVAEGVADIFYKDVLVHDWDLAAPQLILEEAGGVVTDGCGGKILYRGGYDVQGLWAIHKKGRVDYECFSGSGASRR